MLRVPIADIRPLIDWLYFFHAWRTPADSEAGRDLRADAEARLDLWMSDPDMDTRAVQAFYPAHRMPVTPRQTHGNHLSISDWVHHSDTSLSPSTSLDASHGISGDVPSGASSDVVPSGASSGVVPSGASSGVSFSSSDTVPDFGLFACTISPKLQSQIEHLASTHEDDYELLLLETLASRLAEATSEYLWQQLGWVGIRPAVGYPCLPDQRLIFEMAKLLDYAEAGISLTCNGAMYPPASVSGFYIHHPSARYFTIR